MKIEFNDQGSDSVITLTSTVSNSAFTTALLIRRYFLPLPLVLSVAVSLFKTVITGKTSHITACV